jgi:uncharacterized protein
MSEPRTSVVRDFTDNSKLNRGLFETYSGKQIALFDPQPDQIDIWDIAHHLSMICRYGGACKHRYSVAEHCVHVHDEFVHVYNISPDSVAPELLRRKEEVALALLMHDAHEAYVGDLTRPLLSHPAIAEAFLPIAERIQTVIEQVYNVDSIPTALLEEYDDIVLRAEARQLVHSQGRTWNFQGVDDRLISVHCWEPAQAKQQFLTRFNRYRPFPDAERTATCVASTESFSNGVVKVTVA